MSVVRIALVEDDSRHVQKITEYLERAISSIQGKQTHSFRERPVILPPAVHCFCICRAAPVPQQFDPLGFWIAGLYTCAQRKGCIFFAVLILIAIILDRIASFMDLHNNGMTMGEGPGQMLRPLVPMKEAT